MKSKYRWSRLPGSTKAKITRLISSGWSPGQRLYADDRTRFQPGDKTPSVSAQDISMIEEKGLRD